MVTYPLNSSFVLQPDKQSIVSTNFMNVKAMYGILEII